MAQLNIRIDDDLKANAEDLFHDLGLNISTATIMFMKQAVRQRSIPFEITAKKDDDPFWSEENQAHLRKAVAALNAGEDLVYKTIAELKEMENE